jgi:hypothetical protein
VSCTGSNRGITSLYAIATVILADKGFLFWGQESNTSIEDALDVYARQPTEDAIARGTEEAVMGYQEHHSWEEFDRKVIEIALENRLCE